MIRPLLLGLSLLMSSSPLLGQQGNISRAFELERRGDYAAAADIYRQILGARPSDVAALLGLERVLVPVNRAGEMLPQARAALAAGPSNGVVYGVALRVWAALDQPDSMRSVAERWAAFAPADEMPYREWGAAALGRGDHDGALQAYALARERLNRPDALAAERAQLAGMDGDYAAALREWVAALRRMPGFRLTAVGALTQAPAASRPALLRDLGRENDFVARRLEADLRVRWGDPTGGLKALMDALPQDRGPAVEALRGIIDQLRTQQSQEGKAALARGLEALAELAPEADRARIRLDAAQAYTNAGDRDAARRMLAGLAEDRSASGQVAAGASAQLVQVLIAEGQLEEAGRRLAEAGPALSGDDREALRLGLVAGWLKEGEVSRAEAALGADSTVEALALAGRIRLYHGDVAGAVDRLRKAGPYAGDRADATERTALLALLQPIESDSLALLGRGMLQLERGDTSHAVGTLEEVSRGLPAGKGGAGVAFFAGRLAEAQGHHSDAERLFHSAAASAAPGTAPAAELALGELFLSQDRASDAVTQLEHLILTYPESALVPQARRRLDQARGAVPKT
jgi:tetratricopeptide (TPR) repeat protein